MAENQLFLLKRALKRVVRQMLKLNTLQFVMLFVMIAIIISVVIVLTIDLLWDGRINLELEFAGVLTPFLDCLLLLVLWLALFGELREEVERRKAAEQAVRELNESLEVKVRERTKQLLEVQDALVQHERLTVLGQVADSVGHELRNPLGVMSNAVYFLRAVLPGTDETTKDYLSIIESEIAEADRIVSDLLDAVRTKPPHPASVTVEELVSKTLRKCAIPSTVTVRLDIPEGLPPVLVDPLQMLKVFQNLITNGVEAMSDGGVLEIRAVANEVMHTLRISIQDSGIGMPPEHLAQLFQPMFTTKTRHVGLGLMVVKNLTEANGGSVKAQSEPEIGTTFSVTLPCGNPTAGTT